MSANLKRLANDSGMTLNQYMLCALGLAEECGLRFCTKHELTPESYQKVQPLFEDEEEHDSMNNTERSQLKQTSI